MKRTSIISAALFAALVLVSCGGSDKSSTDSNDSVTDAEAMKHEQEQDVTRTEAGKPEFTVDDIFRKQLTEVFDSYVELKDAFVSSEVDKVKKEAEDAMSSLAKVDMKLVSGPAHNDWMNYQGSLESSLKAIASGSDLEKQRAEFSKLSGEMYKTIKAFGLSGKTAYYDFCPMAFNDKGAYWLSDEEKIHNPYFGDKMLTCGSVEETLQ